MNDNNLINQQFRVMIAKRERLGFSNLYHQLCAGLKKQKIRYFISSNCLLLTRIRNYLLEK